MDTPPWSAGGESWWRTAVVYQVYIRSFADGNGDGIGDVAGLRARLPYLADLGVDVLWINPWYRSPQADAGYDVTDYRDIDPAYGTLPEAEAFIVEAHAAGLRVILDIVPNHTSAAHGWFSSALDGDPCARARYIFRPGRGEGGKLPPNDWHSQFGGPAWTRVPAANGAAGEWYLHLFSPQQPDLNWENDEVRQEFEDILSFWFDRGVDGFRIDVAHGLTKTPGLPDAGVRESPALDTAPHPAWDHDNVHEIYRSWRKIADSYDPPRIFVAESWAPSNERLAMYVRPDELHMAFQFDFLQAPFRADYMRAVAEDAMSTVAAVHAPSTWVLSNHDVVRHVTRYARSQPMHTVDRVWEQQRWEAEEPDVELGLRRARAALMVVLALPGSVYLYQGEELGLPEVEDIPADRRRDPVFEQSGRTFRGRDGCRVPLPWSEASPTYGFSAADASTDPWLPQPDGWGNLTAAAQAQDAGSTLTFYRRCLRLRTRLLDRSMAWVDSPPDTMAFRRDDVECWLNTGPIPVPLPQGHVLLTSISDESRDVLHPNTAAWIQTS
ncbi:MAG: glycoside hydrolase family 13 protein [Nocardioidaceae bacterium]|nr:glycoside hydrolase family 13 protein [Nocardioidaceae bacterium]